MLGSYLQSAFRNAFHNPLYAIVNVVGLAVGLACCTLILLFVLDETSYDQHWAEADNIYRVSVYGKPGSGFDDVNLAVLSGAFARQMEIDFPDIRETTLLFRFNPLISRDENRFYEEDFFYADPNFFKVFDFDFVTGDPETAILEPNTIVLTQETAARYFGSEDPIGKTVNYGGLLDLEVTGIIEDFGHRTHISADMFTSLETLDTIMGAGAQNLFQNWGGNQFYTYVLLKEGDTGEELEAQLGEFFARHAGEQMGALLGHKVQPLTDIHLLSQKQVEMKPSGDIDMVYMFSAIAIAILLIAVINFANLTTARGTLRAKEVGVRKVAGATRGGIASQFLLESGIFVIVAVLLAVLLTSLALPWFNGFTGKSVSLTLLLAPAVLVPALLLVVLVTALAGAWPAAFLSGFRPAMVIKGSASESGSGLLRKGLVVLQFAVSVGLGISTAIVFQQMDYARSLPLGYDKEDVVIVNYKSMREEQAEAREALIAEWERHPDIISAAGASQIPTDELLNGTGILPPGGDPENPLNTRMTVVDYDYFSTFGIDMAAGRAFSRDRGSEILPNFGPGEDAEDRATTSAIIINERAVRAMGLGSPDDAIGQQMTMEMGPPGSDAPAQTLNIIGVTEDIYFTSVRSEIQPQAYFLSPVNVSQFAIRLSGRNRADALRHIDETWNSMVPSYPITRTFLEDRFDALYQNEARAAQIFSIFTVIAFMVAALGLFGLAAFATTRRTKEVGVRKVLGASVPSIVSGMTWDFSKLVIIASVIAAPIAWYVMQGWLEGFAYRTGISPFIFAGAILAAFTLSTLVVLFHATRAASVRPAFSLRDE